MMVLSQLLTHGNVDSSSRRFVFLLAFKNKLLSLFFQTSGLKNQGYTVYGLQIKKISEQQCQQDEEQVRTPFLSNIIFLFMCDVQQFSGATQHDMSIGSQDLTEREEVPLAKQVEKKKMITPYKILIGLAVFCVFAMVSYKLYSLAYAGAAVSKITNSHSKFIQNADSSSDPDSGSQSGSQSSKSSTSSDKPLGASKPVGKEVVSSVFNNGGSGGDGEGPSEEDNDGEKRKKNLTNNKHSDGTSTEGDSEEDTEGDDEDSDQVTDQGIIWPNNRGGSMPLVGSERP